MKIIHYIHLMRLHKPIGIFLLLWPMMWALWLASAGKPDVNVVMIFILGVFVMRSAGCIINDFADRHVDGYVARTRERPLAAGKIKSIEAIILFFILMSFAFLLVLQLNRLTIFLAIIAAILAVIYPFMKRFTHLPQTGLGFAFAMSVPMAFAALTDSLPDKSWLVFSVAALWPMIYDTMYAMADRADDLQIGVKSTAILFGNADRLILSFLQMIFVSLLIAMGIVFRLNVFYFISLLVVSGLCIYQQFLIKDRDPKKCFQAFLNNHWLGLIIFLGIYENYC